MNDSVNILEERRDDAAGSAPVERTYSYYYWSAALDEFYVPAQLLEVRAAPRKPGEEMCGPPLVRPHEADIEKRVSSIKNEYLLLLLRSGAWWL